MALQYDTPVTTDEFTAALAANPDISAATTAAISTLLGLDTAESVVVAAWDGISTDVTLPEGSVADVVAIAVAGTDPVTLDLPASVADAPVLIIQSDADVTLTVGQDTPVNANARFAAVDLNDRVVVGGNGDDKLTVLGSTNVTLDGGAGNDVLVTGSGNDTITAGTGNNTISAGAGNDTVITGLGHDVINTGDGFDTVQVQGASTAYTASITGDLLVLNSADTSVTLQSAEFVSFSDGHTLAIASTDEQAAALRLYEGLLGRDADQSGAETFTNQINNGTSVIEVAEQFLTSGEHYTALRTDFVDDLYQSLLGRDADAGGEANWLSQFEQGATRGDVAAAIANSAEGQASTTTDTDYISALYESALGREADQDGLDTWVTQLTTGSSRADVADAIYSSSEAGLKNISDFVDSLYETALGRDANLDTAGKATWTDALEHGATQAEVAIAIVGSAEAVDHNTNVVVVHGAV